MKENNIKVSILIPVYGVEKYIERCAISLLEQTYSNIEYIFVNDCTKDKSIKILESVISRYPDRILQVKIINHRHNLGLGGSRLTALQNATGDYIWQVDSDDWVEKDAVKKCIPYMNRSIDIILFNYDIIDNKRVIKTVCHKKADISSMITNTNYGPSVWKHFIKRELLIEHDIFPIVGINMAEDYLMMARAYLVAKKIQTVNTKPLYHYSCLVPGSYTSNITKDSLDQTCEATILVYEFFKKYNKAVKYRYELIFVMLDRLINILAYDKSSIYVVKILNTITIISPKYIKYCILPFLNCLPVIVLQKKIFGKLLLKNPKK